MLSQTLIVQDDEICAWRLHFTTNQIWRISFDLLRIHRENIPSFEGDSFSFSNMIFIPGSKNLILSNGLPKRCFVKFNMETKKIDNLINLLDADQRIGSLISLNGEIFISTYDFPHFKSSDIFRFIELPSGSKLQRLDNLSDYIKKANLSSMLRWNNGLAFVSANSQTAVFEENNSMRLCRFDLNSKSFWGTGVNGSLLVIEPNGDKSKLLGVSPDVLTPILEWSIEDQPWKHMLGFAYTNDGRLLVAGEDGIYWITEANNQWHQIS